LQSEAAWQNSGVPEAIHEDRQLNRDARKGGIKYQNELPFPGASEPLRECIANALRAPGAQPLRARLAPLGAQVAAQ
jgi:hypothetical protein